MRLNLGCGFNKLDGCVNVDKSPDCRPDKVVDLEVFPWPFGDDSVDEIHMIHVLEHLGAQSDVYLNIFKEMYRICCPNAKIRIVVPHPRHDHFLDDPTHVRAVTPLGLALFSKKLNHEWIKKGNANTPLGVYIDVDFELVSHTMTLAPYWEKKMQNGKMTQEEIQRATEMYNNVVTQYEFLLKVIK